MAIITRDEVKEILQITGTDQDTLIDTLIPQAEGMFLIVRGIPFFEIEADITTGDATITEVLDNDILKVDVNSFLEASGIPEGTYVTEVNSWKKNRVSIIENTIEMSANASATTENLLITIYPPNSKYASAKIIGYMLEKTSASGMKSENIGNYSYDKIDSKSGLPKDITALIQQYQSIKT
jgi:hypothetical protein